MKHVKTLGLAAVAAAALMAFVGASTASATVLCKTKPNASGNCPAGWGYSGEIHAVSTSKWVTTTTYKTIECDESTLKASTTEGTGSLTETPNGAVQVLTAVGNCNCTVVIVKTGTIEIHAIGDTGNGTVTSNEMTETVNCSTIFGTVHCNYVTTNADLGTMVGGTTPTMTITMTPTLETTSSICEVEVTWHISYKFTTPDSLWVATATG